MNKLKSQYLNSTFTLILIVVLSIGLAFVKKFIADFPLKEVFTLWAIIIPAYFGKRVIQKHKSFKVDV